MTISFGPKNAETPSPPIPRPERPVDWHARIAVVLAVCALAIEMAGIWVLARLAGWFGVEFPLADAMALAVMAAVAIGGLYGFRWTRRNVLRVWEHEDEDRELARPVQREEFVEQVVAFPSGEAIRSVAAKLLTLHHTGQTKDEQDCTRPWCITNKICTDDEWGFANRVLQAIRAKKERGWEDVEVGPSYHEAMAKLYKGSFEPDGYNAQVDGQWVRFRDYPLTTGYKRG